MVREAWLASGLPRSLGAFAQSTYSPAMTRHHWTSTDADQEFAWVPPNHLLVEPLRATPLFETKGEAWDTVATFHQQSRPFSDAPTALMTLHHPDEGPLASNVLFSDLRGPWGARPLRHMVEATGWDPRKTWARIAEDRYAWVQNQRDLADRLTRLGIPRCRRHYAGRGGTSADVGRQIDANLVLTHRELLHLVHLAERESA